MINSVYDVIFTVLFLFVSRLTAWTDQVYPGVLNLSDAPARFILRLKTDGTSERKADSAVRREDRAMPGSDSSA